MDILIPSPRHDAIIYGIEGGVYPHAANVMGEFKHTGDLHGGPYALTARRWDALFVEAISNGP